MNRSYNNTVWDSWNISFMYRAAFIQQCQDKYSFPFYGTFKGSVSNGFDHCSGTSCCIFQTWHKTFFNCSIKLKKKSFKWSLLTCSGVLSSFLNLTEMLLSAVVFRVLHHTRTQSSSISAWVQHSLGRGAGLSAWSSLTHHGNHHGPGWCPIGIP